MAIRDIDSGAAAILPTVHRAGLRYDPATQAYAQRRTAEGKTPVRSNAASSATSPETSTASSKTHP